MTERTKIPVRVVDTVAYEVTVVRGTRKVELTRSSLTSLIGYANVWLSNGYNLEGDIVEVKRKRLVLEQD